MEAALIHLNTHSMGPAVPTADGEHLGSTWGARALRVRKGAAHAVTPGALAGQRALRFLDCIVTDAWARPSRLGCNEESASWLGSVLLAAE